MSHVGHYDYARLPAQQHAANEAELGMLSDTISHIASQHGPTTFWHLPPSSEAGSPDHKDGRQHCCSICKLHCRSQHILCTCHCIQWDARHRAVEP